MDRIDKNILAHLQRNASISNVELADRVGLAPSSCLRRVRRLWDTGVIKRTVALTDDAQMGRNVKCIVSIKLHDHSNAARRDWLRAMEREPAITQVYTISGDMDAVVIMALENMQEFQRLSDKLFSENSNVLQFVTQFVLEENKFELGR